MAASQSVGDWLHIAQVVDSRSAKQCRDRWLHVLCPTVNKAPFTPPEDKALLEAVAQHGKKWAVIARDVFEHKRTDNQCKNRWKNLQNGVMVARAREARAAQQAAATLRVEPLELSAIVDDIVEEEIAASSPVSVTEAHALKDHSLLPPPAKTSRSWTTIMRGSLTGIEVNFNQYIGFNKAGPFDAVNRALRARPDARTFAYDGLPRHYNPFDINETTTVQHTQP